MMPSWIKKTVLFAYQDASQEETARLQARPLDLRAMAANLEPALLSVPRRHPKGSTMALPQHFHVMLPKGHDTV